MVGGLLRLGFLRDTHHLAGSNTSLELGGYSKTEFAAKTLHQILVAEIGVHMDILIADPANLDKARAAKAFVDYLKANEVDLLLAEATVYIDYPIYRDDEGTFVTTQALITSPTHGIIMIAPTDVNRNASLELSRVDELLDHAFSCLFSRLIRNKELRKTKTTLSVPFTAAIYAPFLSGPLPELGVEVISNNGQLSNLLGSTIDGVLRDGVYQEMQSTIEGAKGLIRSKVRTIDDVSKLTKGRIASEAEMDIASFDLKQKKAYIGSPEGVERIRGLAGSGKTVILAMKAALTHLRHPDAEIVYTFSTKSLYQHIQRLITRFYRQYDDRDPNWDKLRIMHAWGGRSNPGVYSLACERHGLPSLTFKDAVVLPEKDAFDGVCTHLLKQTKIQPMYDFVFVDEGQDFPASFIRLATSLAKGEKLAWAYDDLQTIFRATTPTAAEIYGVDANGRPNVEFVNDIILSKCYRNPREVLVCAHAVGFGVYGPRIVQMLESGEYWNNLGYKTKTGKFVSGEKVEIERPAENSLATISDNYKATDIVQLSVFENADLEIADTVSRIRNDIADGLRPDDILVICVDDRYAKRYLSAISVALYHHGIRSNNIHNDGFGLVEFSREGEVTLSTVHKAKGNEAFSVYVLGVDSLYSPLANVKERNMLFTAMTRAKGWVHVSGIGESAAFFKKEITQALANCPFLRFTYPNPDQLKIMKQDLAEDSLRKQEAEKLLESLVELYGVSAEEVEQYIKHRKIKKNKLLTRPRKEIEGYNE